MQVRFFQSWASSFVQSFTRVISVAEALEGDSQPTALKEKLMTENFVGIEVYPKNNIWPCTVLQLWLFVFCEKQLCPMDKLTATENG